MLKLIPPGKRRNKTYYIFGRYEGEKIEISTGTDDYKLAKEFLRTHEDNLKKRKKVKKVMSFSEAAQSYIEHKNPSDYDEKMILRMCQHIGDKPIMDVVKDDVYRVVRSVMSKLSPASQNRHGITPISSILNYAADNEWRSAIKIERYNVPDARTRYLTDDHELWLRMAVDGNEQKTLFLLWCFRQGDRLSDVVKVKYEDIDLEKQIFYRYISKTKDYVPTSLDLEICAILKARDHKEGKIFTWRTSSGPYLCFKNLARRLEIRFSPHMCRHTVGKRLSDSGASLRVIMDKLGHRDAKSSLRYQKGDIESVREASKVLSRVVISVGDIQKDQ